jgi:nitroreductase
MGLLQGTPPRLGPEQRSQCIRCQHCMAICPTGALSIDGKNPSDSIPLSKDSFPSLEYMERLVQGRRSVRQYQDKNVDPARIQQLLDALAYVPTGVNAQALTISVIDQKTVLSRLREQVLSGLDRCAKSGRIPEHLSFLGTAPSAFNERGIDMIFRGAPHLLVVSAPLTAPGAQTDTSIALTTFELMATCAGLGTVWCGLLKMALEVAPDLKPLLELPLEGIHYYPMLFGYPAVKYARTVQREGAAVIKRLS